MRSKKLVHAEVWRGIEVERTQFYGMETLFVVPRHPDLDDYVELLTERVPDYMRYKHFYFGAVRLHNLTNSEKLVECAYKLLKQEKYVTIEVQQNDFLVNAVTQLRAQYPASFCLLMRVVVPDLFLRGFAVKVVPLVPFDEARVHEGGVMCVTSDELDKRGVTLWNEYKTDRLL